MAKRLLSLVAIVTLAIMALSAQSRGGLRINEVMVVNDSSVVDDYGQHQAWIELFNTKFAPVEISSVYLTNDKNNPKMYPVPMGDVNTKIPKRQHVIFWADNEPTRGTFHLNFKLVPGQDNWIGLYDADGLTLIDEVVIPATLPAGASYARIEDGVGDRNDAAAWQVRDGSTPDLYITPSSNNVIKDQNEKVRLFNEKDKSGFGLTIMAMCIVFSALLLLCLSFYGIGSIGKKMSNRRKLRAQGINPHEATREELRDHDTGEEIAAIVAALNQHFNVHDHENTILTINKVRRSYSPWSSKIYGLREIPRK